MSDRRLIIAIDGPAGAGKSTIARRVAQRLGYLFINTGAMYRAVAWKAMNQGLSPDDTEEIGRVARESSIQLTGDVDSLRVSIDGHDITSEIIAPRITEAASKVSAIPAVRRAMVARQQELGKEGGIVMEGRDIGSQVFPNADVKIYLDATTDARSRRRFDEDTARGIDVGSLEQMRTEIEARDLRDKTRADSPLILAHGSIYIDSSDLSIDQVVEKIIEITERVRGK